MPQIKSDQLKINSPIVGSSSDAGLTISIAPNTPLKPGSYVFQLQVTDDSGNVSAPTSLRLIVTDTERPTAVIDGPDRVPMGTSFTLSGNRSADVGGKIVSYTWTLLQQP